MTIRQVGASIAVGRGQNGGWFRDVSIRAGWIIYALATTQYDFILASTLSVATQVKSFVSATKSKVNELELASVIFNEPGLVER